MISKLTRVQLVVFAIVTLLGGAVVGGRYAQIDRLVIDRTYPVTVELRDSGGIFAGAQVTYRGIAVGRVDRMDFTESGVEAELDIENDAPDIPADVKAVVANKSAIGEQYMDLQPQSNSEPYLKAGDRIAVENSQIPLDTSTLLIDLDNLVKSVDTDNLQTVVSELGQAFEGTGPDLATILDTSNRFINAASDNLPVTRALIRNSGTVLQTQLDTQSALRTFSENLAGFSDTLVDVDPDFRRLLNRGTGSARTLRTVVDENAEDLTIGLNNLATVADVLEPNVLATRVVFTLYPYLIQGSYGVVQPSKVDEGEFDAAFGLVLQGPAVCSGPDSGYREQRSTSNIEDVAFPAYPGIDCTLEPNDIVRQASKTEIQRRVAAQSGATDRTDSLSWLMLDTLTR